LKNTRFENSFKSIFGDQIGISSKGESFFQDFYTLFTSRSEEISDLFARTDMSRQIAMVKASLYQMVTFYASGVLTESMRGTARAHEHLNIPPQLYDIWLDCLIEAVALHDPVFDEKTELAWRLALSPGITFMKLACENSIRPLEEEKARDHTPRARE